MTVQNGNVATTSYTPSATGRVPYSFIIRDSAGNWGTAYTMVAFVENSQIPNSSSGSTVVTTNPSGSVQSTPSGEVAQLTSQPSSGSQVPFGQAITFSLYMQDYEGTLPWYVNIDDMSDPTYYKDSSAIMGQVQCNANPCFFKFHLPKMGSNQLGLEVYDVKNIRVIEYGFVFYAVQPEVFGTSNSQPNPSTESRSDVQSTSPTNITAPLGSSAQSSNSIVDFLTSPSGWFTIVITLVSTIVGIIVAKHYEKKQTKEIIQGFEKKTEEVTQDVIKEFTKVKDELEHRQEESEEHYPDDNPD